MSLNYWNINLKSQEVFQENEWEKNYHNQGRLKKVCGYLLHLSFNSLLKNSTQWLIVRVQSGLSLTPTKKDLQGVSMKVQSFCLLLHHIHLLSVLVVIAVYTRVRQHLHDKLHKYNHKDKENNWKYRNKLKPFKILTFRAWARILQASITNVKDFICKASFIENTLFSRLIAKSYRKQ